MKPYWMVAFGLLGISPALGCSSTPPKAASPPGASCDPCDDSGTGTGAPTTQGLNPDGVAYPAPATGYGRAPRSGSQAGSVITNYQFLGYKNGVQTATLQNIALADYFDPCQKRYKMLHITVAAVWCPPCNMETDAVVAAKAKLDAQGIIVIQALDDGPTMNVPATQQDLDYWIVAHKSNFTEMLDPGLQNLGGFFLAAEVPWNADIDVRTMEILSSGVGYEDPSTDTGVQSDYAAVTTQPPRYTLAASCP